MKVSVIMSSGSKRPHTLRRTLQSWSKVDYPLEFVLVNTDPESKAVGEVAREFPRLISKFVNKPAWDRSVDWATTARVWSREGKLSSGDYVIFAMADEILGGYDIIDRFITTEHPYRTSVRNYFLSQEHTATLDDIDWISNPAVIENYQDFWTHTDVEGADNTGNIFRKNMSANIYSHITGAPRNHWEYMNWFRQDEYGYLWLDNDLYIRETVCNRPCHTLENFYCYHQWHPLLKLSAKDRDYGGYAYSNEMQARLLEPAKHIVSGEYR